MIGFPLLAGIARRFGGDLLAGATLTLLVVGLGWGIYRWGAGNTAAQYEVEIRAMRAEADAERERLAVKVAEAEFRAAQVQTEAERRLADLARAEAVNSQKIERVLRENPGFAATVRPADLQRVRDEELDSLEQAATRAPDLRGGGIRGLRAPGQGGGEDPRRN